LPVTDKQIGVTDEAPSLLRNDLSGKQNWLKVKLHGVKSYRSAIGARVLVRYAGKTQAQAVVSQSSLSSCNDPWLHFGLGSSRLADLDIYWPSGLRQGLRRVRGNQLITVKEGVGIVTGRGSSRT
jgi:hypothetical protein